MSFWQSLFGKPVPTIEAREAQARLQSPEPPFLLDVREPEEYVVGHIAGARLIPLGELPRRIHELPRDREILCVCHSGSRSRAAAQQLMAAGLRSVNLNGGMLAWEGARLPVKRGKDA
jgi:rhodanese-related sulfurtransferase